MSWNLLYIFPPKPTLPSHSSSSLAHNGKGEKKRKDLITVGIKAHLWLTVRWINRIYLFIFCATKEKRRRRTPMPAVVWYPRPIPICLYSPSIQVHILFVQLDSTGGIFAPLNVCSSNCKGHGQTRWAGLRLGSISVRVSCTCVHVHILERTYSLIPSHGPTNGVHPFSSVLFSLSVQLPNPPIAYYGYLSPFTLCFSNVECTPLETENRLFSSNYPTSLRLDK